MKCFRYIEIDFAAAERRVPHGLIGLVVAALLFAAAMAKLSLQVRDLAYAKDELSATALASERAAATQLEQASKSEPQLPPELARAARFLSCDWQAVLAPLESIRPGKVLAMSARLAQDGVDQSIVLSAESAQAVLEAVAALNSRQQMRGWKAVQISQGASAGAGPIRGVLLCAGCLPPSCGRSTN